MRGCFTTGIKCVRSATAMPVRNHFTTPNCIHRPARVHTLEFPFRLTSVVRSVESTSARMILHRIEHLLTSATCPQLHFHLRFSSSTRLRPNPCNPTLSKLMSTLLKQSPSHATKTHSISSKGIPISTIPNLNPKQHHSSHTHIHFSIQLQNVNLLPCLPGWEELNRDVLVTSDTELNVSDGEETVAAHISSESLQQVQQMQCGWQTALSLSVLLPALCAFLVISR
ncbi:hypothetical protein KC19_12G112400 [Ceratodon purpureus]|uniref:Uncharacterized protein n=1 Tax=Ceratodon purpureus TaxID=3225 RepID=A0A8T0G603_CERPU|nr:hypothetical protein KC19_12G112400 [Ceratodon purpureus]